MAVFRIERTRDYTVMSNHHLRNHELSLKAKGLLSMMLSLPDDWNYLRRSHVLVVCGHGIDETVKNDIATAERLRITATTLDGILTVKGQGRGKGGVRHA